MVLAELVVPAVSMVLTGDAIIKRPGHIACLCGGICFGKNRELSSTAVGRCLTFANRTMKMPNQSSLGIYQFFYHCTGEELPIRDVCNRQGHGRKTEPHYENVTENWCGKCMNGRIKSANRKELDYLFLVTRYWNANHTMNGKLLVVGFLYRAEPEVWRKLSLSIKSGAQGYDHNEPQNCGFFAGDKNKSHFVSAENAFPLDEKIKNPRWIYFAAKEEAQRIIYHLKKSKNILEQLREQVKQLQDGLKSNNCEKAKCDSRC